ncbi:MAG: hypothetical protein EBY07_06655 [Actinobacteria bacterium]|nr:hypothetical protein [Actinomycetota bacterium]
MVYAVGVERTGVELMNTVCLSIDETRCERREKPADKCDGAGANPPMAPALSALPLRARLPAESAGGLVTCDIP